MTGREIIKKAEEQSGGRWAPSPGLIYPLLSRLLVQELIEETEKGGYTLTKKGLKDLEQINKIKRGLSEQYDILTTLGFAGKFIVQDAVDRVITFVSTAREELDKLGEKQRAKYKSFLRSELRRLDKKEEVCQPPEENEHDES